MCGCWGGKMFIKARMKIIILVVIFIRLKIHPRWFLPHLWVDDAQWGSAEVVGPVIDS